MPKKKIVLSLFSLLIIGICSSFVHPFFVSVTHIDQKKQNGSLEISSRIFYDDLEVELSKFSGRKIDLIKQQNDPQVDSLLSKYMKQHLKIKINGKENTLKYVGYELDKEVAWCYLEIVKHPKIKSLDIYNNILYSNFKNQSNIVHATILGVRKSSKLDNPKSSATLIF